MKMDEMIPMHSEFWFSEKWQNYLADQPETGMDYQVVKIVTSTGDEYGPFAVHGCRMMLTTEGSAPFEDKDIAHIRVWNSHTGEFV